LSEEKPEKGPMSEEKPEKEPMSAEKPENEPLSEEKPEKDPMSEEKPEREPMSEEKPIQDDQNIAAVIEEPKEDSFLCQEKFDEPERKQADPISPEENDLQNKIDSDQPQMEAKLDEPNLNEPLVLKYNPQLDEATVKKVSEEPNVELIDQKYSPERNDAFVEKDNPELEEDNDRINNPDLDKAIVNIDNPEILAPEPENKYGSPDHEEDQDPVEREIEKIEVHEEVPHEDDDKEKFNENAEEEEVHSFHNEMERQDSGPIKNVVSPEPNDENEPNPDFAVIQEPDNQGDNPEAEPIIIKPDSKIDLSPILPANKHKEVDAFNTQKVNEDIVEQEEAKKNNKLTNVDGVESPLTDNKGKNNLPQYEEDIEAARVVKHEPYAIQQERLELNADRSVCSNCKVL
jgi:hypothetical protein